MQTKAMYAAFAHGDLPKQILMSETIFYAFIIILFKFFISIAFPTNKLFVNFNFFIFYLFDILFPHFHAFEALTIFLTLMSSL